MKLSDLKENQVGHITKINGGGEFRRRLSEMGFVKGKQVSVIKYAPLKDPIEFNIMGYEVSLRKSEAEEVEIEITNQENSLYIFNGTSKIDRTPFTPTIYSKENEINIALIGNPNCGKTTIFNHISGAKEKVGNYGGVTVNTKEGHFNIGKYRINITDLPGTYSITAQSPEEQFVRRHIFDRQPDLVINIVDASNLERNLLLTTQLIDMGIDIVMALNMFDEFEEKGDDFDYKALGEMIGIPIVPTVGSKGTGINKLFEKVVEVYENKEETVRKVNINYGQEIEKSISKIENLLDNEVNNEHISMVSHRYLAIKLIEHDQVVIDKLINLPNINEIREIVNIETQRLEKHFIEKSETILTDAKYGFISGALKETYKSGKIDRYENSKLIDKVLTNKYLGFPFFIAFMWLIFQATFTLGDYPMTWIETGIQLLSNGIGSLLTDGPLKDLIIDGAIAGVGSVIVFLPNILILFFFLSVMEDSGYMARVAFIMDKLMHKIGLHGKSVIPLIMGFGCNVPAIMATRTLESKNDRLLTMLINPFMSCSARLSVYILIIGAFFPDYPGTVLFTIYFLGVLIAILVAIIFKKFLFKNSETPFVMELPPYRVPTFKTAILHMWHKGSQYLKKMGGPILIASIIIWAMGYYPQEFDGMDNYKSQITELEQQILSTPSQENTEQLKLQAHDLKIEMESKRQENSIIGKTGKFIEPAIQPLGFDWKMGISLITGMAAKEVVVSTMGVLYQVDEDLDETSQSLKTKLQQIKYKDGEKEGQFIFNPLVAFSYMVFILIYFPCIAVIAAINKESGSWKWAVFTMVYTTALAYFASLLVYQIGTALGFG